MEGTPTGVIQGDTGSLDCSSYVFLGWQKGASSGSFGGTVSAGNLQLDS